jgi:predicted transcriptional regulator
MTTMTIRIPEQDKELIQAYARIHGMSAADVLRTAALERIEDEFDLHELDEAIATSSGEFISHEEVKRKLGF